MITLDTFHPGRLSDVYSLSQHVHWARDCRFCPEASVSMTIKGLQRAWLPDTGAELASYWSEERWESQGG